MFGFRPPFLSAHFSMKKTHSNGAHNGTLNGSTFQGWKTAIVTSDPGNIWIRGYDTVSLMRRGSFADVIYLLHRGELPTAAERRLIEALLFVASEPLDVKDLAACAGIAEPDVEEALQELDRKSTRLNSSHT